MKNSSSHGPAYLPILSLSAEGEKYEGPKPDPKCNSKLNPAWKNYLSVA